MKWRPMISYEGPHYSWTWILKPTPVKLDPLGEFLYGPWGQLSWRKYVPFAGTINHRSITLERIYL